MTTKEKIEFGMICRKMRNKVGLSQDKAAEYLNISKRHLQYIESG